MSNVKAEACLILGTCPQHCLPSCSKSLRAVILLTVERERQLTSFPKFLILSHSIKNRPVSTLSQQVVILLMFRNIHTMAAGLAMSCSLSSFRQQPFYMQASAQVQAGRWKGAAQRHRRGTRGTAMHPRGRLHRVWLKNAEGCSSPALLSGSPSHLPGPHLPHPLQPQDLVGSLGPVSCFFLSTTSSSCLTISSLGRCW